MAGSRPGPVVRPRSTTAVRSWCVRGPDPAPAGSCRRQRPSARTAPCSGPAHAAAPATSRRGRPSCTRWNDPAHTLAREDLRLAIQRKVVGIFVDQHMRQQRLGRHAAVDWPLRRGRLHDGLLAGPAAIARPADHLNAKLGGDVVQHLGTVFADRMQRRTTARAGLVVDIDHDLDPRQMRRQRTAIALRRRRWPRRGWLSRLELRPPARPATAPGPRSPVATPLRRAVRNGGQSGCAASPRSASATA